MRRAILWLLLFWPLSASLAAESLTLSEGEAVRRALAGNLSLAGFRTELRSTQLAADSAWGVLVPSLSATGSLSRANREATLQPPASPYSWTASAQLAASVSISPATIERVHTTRLELLSGRISLEEAEQAVAIEVRKLFYRLILQRERITVTRSSIATADETLAQARSDYANGRVPRLYVRQAELAAQNARLLLERQLVDLRNSEAQLKNLLGIDPATELSLEGSIVARPPEIPDTSGARIEERSDVRSVSARIAVEESRNQAARLDLLSPIITLSASYAPALPDPFNMGGNPAAVWGDRGALTLSLSAASLRAILPFVPERVELESGKNTIESLSIRKAEILKTARVEIDSLSRSIEASVVAIESLKGSVAIAQESYDLAREAYRFGSVDFLSLQIAEDSLLSARYDLLSEEYTYLAALIDLEQATGLTLRTAGGD